MCDPVSIGTGIAAVVGAGASLYGSMQQANAAKSQQQAIIDQDNADRAAQATAFTQRNQAAQQQTAAQLAASQETMSARNDAATQMRQAQMNAMQRYQNVLDSENQQADILRQSGDTAAQQLVSSTSADALAAAQAAQQQQTTGLQAQAIPQGQGGPDVTSPTGSTDAVSNDLATGGAIARRTAEAATNIRNYGARIATVGAYGAPLEQVGLATADTKYGIMPTQTAAQLLSSGSGVRLLPTQVGYNAATNLGQAEDTLLQSKGQSALDAAGLSYGNATDLANLQQSNTETTAANIAKQRASDAAAQAATGKLISGIGNLGLYGAGYFGGNPFGAASGWAAGTGAGSGIFTNLATGATSDISGVTMPNARGLLSKIF